MAQNRRLGRHYKKQYEELKGESPFINPIGNTDLAVMDWPNEGKRELEDRIEHFDTLISQAEESGQLVEETFKRYQQGKANAGRKPPGKMEEAPEIRERWETANARLDIVREEKDAIRKVMSKKSDEETVESNTAVLQQGPIGSGKLVGGILVELDGQRVKPDKDGILRIKDKRSRYSGMRTVDYFEQIVKPWDRAKNKLERARRRKAKEQGVLLADLKSARPPLPKWPEGVKGDNAPKPQ